MFCKCMISPFFKWCIIYWGYNPLIFNFQPDIQVCQNSFRSTQWSWIYFPYIQIVKGAPTLVITACNGVPPSWMKIGRPFSRFRFWGKGCSPPARVSPCRTDCAPPAKTWIHLKHSPAARHSQDLGLLSLECAFLANKDLSHYGPAATPLHTCPMRRRWPLHTCPMRCRWPSLLSIR